MKILTAIQVKLTMGEEVSGYEKYFQGKKGFDCYFKYMEGIKAIRGLTVDGTRAGRRFAEEAIAMCPENPMVYTLMGAVYFNEFYVGLGKSPRENIEKGVEMVQKALAMDDSTPAAHGYLGLFYYLKREYERAIAEGERAVALEPGSARSYHDFGLILIYAGRPEEAIPVLQKAIRLNPLGGSNNFQWLGVACRLTGRLEEAVLAYKKALQLSPDNFGGHFGLTVTYSMMGREQEAHLEATEVLRINPKFLVDPYVKKLPFKDRSINDNIAEALRKAGLK